LLALSCIAAYACGSEAPHRAPLVVEDGCQVLLAETRADELSRGRCLLPYPSDAYRVPAPEMPTGHRVLLPSAAKPRRVSDGAEADPHEVYPIDGFSTAPTIVATLPTAVTGDGLPGILDEPSASAMPTSRTLLVDVERGDLVEHYVDVYPRAVTEEHRAIVLRPFAPLRPRARYVVALAGVVAEDGAEAQPPEGFRRLRDRHDDPALVAISDRYEADIFPPLDARGVARERLQLAWDFTTGSAERPIEDMLRVRELTLAWLASNTPEIQITEVGPGPAGIWRRVRGTVSAPLFLDQPGPGARLVRDENGAVRENGATSFAFVVHVPESVRNADGPGRALAFGHGFFGGTAELDGAGARELAERLRAVEFGIDWWGMSKDDVGLLAETLGSKPERTTDFVERVHQAMANWLVMLAAIRGPLATAPELTREAGGGPLYDPSFIAYFGASQGHILGGVLAALAPELSRLVLNVGGGGFTHIMPRSSNFGPFAILLDGAFQDALVVQAFTAMMAPSLDRIDPVTYAPLVTGEPLPGSPPDRRVLLQTALGDNAVPNIGSFLHARALAIPQTMPAPFAIPGLSPFSPGETRSAITVFDYGIDTSGYARPSPLNPNHVHDGLRRNPAAIAQMDAFLRPGGEVIHPCEGPCDPE
jgi:hypothetical protein